MSDQEIRAVDMVRAIRDAMYEETRDMTDEQLLKYFAQKSAASRKKWERAQDQRKSPVATAASKSHTDNTFSAMKKA